MSDIDDYLNSPMQQLACELAKPLQDLPAIAECSGCGEKHSKYSMVIKVKRDFSDMSGPLCGKCADKYDLGRP